ncbi:O-succinylhomoserine sulfhydrylase [Agaricicola taiwanensis]|uniref:O-succinylhomoserine sulfhydrylase n=1 Tax=Agaricicola taiwanensis TaxID=591372 RepID=A0A8J2VNX4_9RHOB|nr:O-succinylhomoserine sulfhydrylase [Agaricicola taiwanensis]GGE35488.1 O-succinylhomoserine sulfhydrylase [Agaricicola taiwanensis]
MTKTSLPDSARPATRAVHGGGDRSHFGELSEALFLTSSFTYDTMEASVARFAGENPGFTYTRTGNPTIAMFEERMALLEGAPAARATATGMAAVNAAFLSLLKAGDHVISARQIFGSCRWLVRELLPKLGIAVTMVDLTDIGAWRAAVRPETRLLFLETPANPTLEIADLSVLSKIAKEADALLVADNALASPAVQNPYRLGADVVTYSATKHIDGHGRCLGGIILSDEKRINDLIAPFLRHSGGSLSPFNAWVLLKSLESISLRVERQASTALRIAQELKKHPKVKRVAYPGLPDHPQAEVVKRQMASGGTVLALELADQAQSFRFANGLKVIRISNNFGDAKSIVTHPFSTTHQHVPAEEKPQLGITPGLLRMSAGLEDPDDLVEDVLQALETV